MVEIPPFTRVWYIPGGSGFLPLTVGNDFNPFLNNLVKFDHLNKNEKSSENSLKLLESIYINDVSGFPRWPEPSCSHLTPRVSTELIENMTSKLTNFRRPNPTKDSQTKWKPPIPLRIGGDGASAVVLLMIFAQSGWLKMPIGKSKTTGKVESGYTKCNIHSLHHTNMHIYIYTHIYLDSDM